MWPTMLVFLLVATLFCPRALCNADSEIQSALAQGKEQLKSKKYASAIKSLEKTIEISPKSAEARLYLGLAYARAKQYQKAKESLRQVWKLAPGTQLAQDANKELLLLPRKVVAPRGKRIVARLRGRRLPAAAIERPKIMYFYASWAQPCKQLKADIEKIQPEWADKIEFIAVDVDDPQNEKLLEQYDVSPIPTVVFINPVGEVASFLIGYSGEQSLLSGLKKALTA